MTDRLPLSRRRRRLRWTWGLLAAASLLGAAISLALYWSSRPATHRPGEQVAGLTSKLSRELPEAAPAPRFVDVTVASGIDFRSFAGDRSSQLPEDMGSGAAWGDFDGDGDEDLFLVSSGGALNLPPSGRSPSELYENLGDGSFRRVTEFPDTRIIGMGAAWGDYDGDGWRDLVVTGYQSLDLFHNDGGRFVRDDRLAALPGFWAGASWGDFDNDRDLDLYVCGYVRYDHDRDGEARTSLQYGKAVPYTLNPSAYPPERNLLFRNDGQGNFTEVAGPLGVANPEGRSLGALWHDFDGDGWLDLYVANDISDNVLFHNEGGTFADVSHPAWVADYRGAMGLAVGDWNGDGDDDLFITHWVAQENALYDSLLVDLRARPPAEPTRPAAEPVVPSPSGRPGPLRFIDVADERGLGQIAIPAIGWGTEFADLDGDGWLDLLVANGSTFETSDVPPRLQPQRPFLFWNRRGEGFHDLAGLSEALATPHVGRGLALSDYDDDGDLDLVLVHHGEGAQLLRNDMQTGNWLKIRLRSRLGGGRKARGSGEGARLVARVDGRDLRRSVSGASYLSQSSQVVHFGLGTADRVEHVTVHWPGGGIDQYADLEANVTWELTEGDGIPRRAGGGARIAARENHPSQAPRGTGDAWDAEAKDRTRAFWENQRAAMRAMKAEGDLDKAITLFRHALALNPAHEDSLYYLGHCLARTGEVDAALSTFQELIRVNPSSHRGHNHWGLLRAASAASGEDLAAAEAALERALEINPEETGVLLILGEVDLLQGENGSAQQRLEWACRTNPRATGGLFLRGYLAWRQGDDGGARELLAAAREALGPDWKPRGTSAEGDVQGKMHAETTLLSRFWDRWDGASDTPSSAFAALDDYLARPFGTRSGRRGVRADGGLGRVAGSR